MKFGKPGIRHMKILKSRLFVFHNQTSIIKLSLLSKQQNKIAVCYYLCALVFFQKSNCHPVHTHCDPPKSAKTNDEREPRDAQRAVLIFKFRMMWNAPLARSSFFFVAGHYHLLFAFRVSAPRAFRKLLPTR